MRLVLVILQVMVWDKVEGSGEGRSGATTEPESEGFGSSQPGRMTKTNLILLEEAQ